MSVDAVSVVSWPADAAGGGTYLLWLRPRRFDAVAIGRLGTMTPRPGYYGYVGSAMGPGGVAARVGRHLRREKPQRWHLDYLRPFCDVVAIWYVVSGRRVEHRWVAALAAMPGAMPAMTGFGASDHPGATHLFHFGSMPPLDHFAARAGGGRIRCLRPSD